MSHILHMCSVLYLLSFKYTFHTEIPENDNILKFLEIKF